MKQWCEKQSPVLLWLTRVNGIEYTWFTHFKIQQRSIFHFRGSAGIRGLTRVLATFPLRANQRSKTPMSSSCWCTTSVHLEVCCGGSPWGEHVHGTWNSVCTLLAYVSFEHLFSVITRATLIIFCVMLVLLCVLSISCSGLVASTWQVIGWKDPFNETSNKARDYLCKNQVEECYIFVSIIIFLFILALHTSKLKFLN